MVKELKSINFCLEAKYIENEHCYDLFICRPGYYLFPPIYKIKEYKIKDLII